MSEISLFKNSFYYILNKYLKNLHQICGFFPTIDLDVLK